MNLRTFSDLILLTRTCIIAEKKPAYWKRVQQKNIVDFVRYIYEIPYRELPAGRNRSDDIVTASRISENFLRLHGMNTETGLKKRRRRILLKRSGI